MRELWVEINSSSPKDFKMAILNASKNLCDTAVVDEEDVELAKKHGFRVASPLNGDIQIVDENVIEKTEKLEIGKNVCLRLEIKNRTDEKKASKAIDKGVKYIIISCPNWKIIPLENLIAESNGRTKLLAEVTSSEEARVTLETLELGADGVVLKASKLEDVTMTSDLIKRLVTHADEKEAILKLEPAKIVSTKPLSMGSRVCIDTCELMTEGEGMLVGCQSSGLFLIQAEVNENPHIQPRPFRVNAGSLSMYILTPNNKTRYLAELKAGDEILIVDRKGDSRTGVVGRVKIEKRPLMLIEANFGGSRVKMIAQNAETIRFVTKDGSKSVSELKAGDEILIHHQSGGRHFGILVEKESIIER